MVKDFMFDQEVKNEAESEIGKDWATLRAISNNASVEEIQRLLNEIDT